MYASWIDVLEPRPLLGGCRWIASPMQNTRPLDAFSAYMWFTLHTEVPFSFTSIVSSPTRLCTISVAIASSTTGAGCVMS